MFKEFLKKWHTKSVLKKINHMSHEVMGALEKKESYNHIEYGNMRKGNEWGELNENTISWTFIIDLIVGKPILYIISYEINEREFTCYAKTSKNNFSNIFQFKTSNDQELKFRLTELAEHVPSLRERMLREYLYSEAKKGPHKKWYNPFVREDKVQDYLESVIDEIITEKKISDNEAKRLHEYAKNLA